MKSPSVLLSLCAAVMLTLGLASLGPAQNRETSVISAKAGGVNSVNGRVMVTRAGNSQSLTEQDDLTTGDLVTTGAASQVEVLLNPGSYLRVGENSAFELADNSLATLRVRLIKGSAIVEAGGLDQTELHITIITEQARVVVARRGVYRINAAADSTELLVRKGRAVINDSPGDVIRSGNGVVFRGGLFVAKKLGKKQQDQFDDWSKERADTLAKANEKLSARGLNTYLSGFDYFDQGRDLAFSLPNRNGVWAFSPFSRCFTFLPFNFGWSSPYGHHYDLYFDGYGVWLRRGCCGGDGYRQPANVYNQPSTGGSSSGSSSGGSSGGSTGGSIGTSRPSSPSSPPPPSQAGPRDPDSGSRSINRIKDPK
jgi:hypothetical protein